MTLASCRGTGSTQITALQAARRRTALLEAEVVIHRQAAELLGVWCPRPGSYSINTHRSRQ